ncbi:fungal specific transcription factor domain-containing protein 76 [Elsinoe australis]|uniref:Fungal specific transcription factor domain-containing protein 76 n=1 Tax=Elsinoe australis TaxID=40998 RepID=A0A4U7AL80_9PEZI|nr:fungal specific transcription factor domain-containing protein 76 [Elsinoe australis]
MTDIFPSPDSSNVVDFFDTDTNHEQGHISLEGIDVFDSSKDNTIVVNTDDLSANQTEATPQGVVAPDAMDVQQGDPTFDFFPTDAFDDTGLANVDFDGLDIFELLPSIQQDVMAQSRASQTPQEGSHEALVFTPSPLPNEAQLPAKVAAQPTEARPAPSTTSTDRTRRDSTETTSTKPMSENSLPHIQKHPCAKAPPIRITPQTRSTIVHDLATRLGPGHSAELPSEVILEKCLRAYLDCCHIHMPFLHLRTFKVNKCPSPLLLAMCAIGSLYRLERNLAGDLYDKASKALERTLANQALKMNLGWVKPKSSVPNADYHPLWVAQTQHLIIFFSTFSGDPKAVRKGLDTLPQLTMDYRFRAAALSHQRQTASDSQNWHDWIELESSKRVLYATFVLSSLLTITYGIPPALSILQDGEVDMPDDEALWNAPTRDQWRLRMVVRKPRPRFTMRDAVVQLMHGETAANGSLFTDWSPLIATIAMHAISVQMWNGIQCVHLYEEGKTLASVISSVPDPESATFGYDYIRVRSFRHLENSLSRCRTMITRSNSEGETTWSDYDGPLLFNCAALMRIAYARSLTGMGALNRIVLLSGDGKLVERMIADYVVAAQTRGAYWNKVMGHVFDGFCTPIKAGMLLTQKTAALTWSIEHAIAGWDTVLLFTKWAHKLEGIQMRCERSGVKGLEEEEVVMLDKLRRLLRDACVDLESKKVTSMAGEMARLWASFYDDTWVWGVTPRIGWVLRELAVAYEKDLTKTANELDKAAGTS